MKKSLSEDFKRKVQHQYDYICCRALQGEAKNYYNQIKKQREKEVLFGEMSDTEMNKLCVEDQYKVEKNQLTVFEFEIEITNDLLEEALKHLTKRKRDVILLSFFEEMSDVEIAKKMKLVRSTVNEHKKRSLEILKELMKEGYITDENK